MKITDILKENGIPSKEIKTRLESGQISLNGEIVKQNLELECSKFIDAGDFLFKFVVINELWRIKCQIIGFENLFNSNIDDDLTTFLKDFTLLKISKKQLLVLIK